MISRTSLLTAVLLCAFPMALHAAPTPSQEAMEDARKLRQQVEKMAPGSSEAMMEFAALVEQGDAGIAPDRAMALDLYEKAAAKGQRIARGKMCLAFLLGKVRPKDLPKAAPYCNSLGPEDPIALFWAAYDFQNGITGPKDETQALDLYALSAAEGSGDAALVLGRKAITDGEPEKARAWFRRGAKLGSTDAMVALADMLDEGKGGPRDSSEATWLYDIAGRLGDASAATKASSRPTVPAIKYTGNRRSLDSVRTYRTDKGPRTEVVSVNWVAQLLSNRYPKSRHGGMSEGDVGLECYVGADRLIDLCLVFHEFPVGLGFAEQITQVFDEHVQLPETDLDGEPTGGRFFSIRWRWRLN